MNQAYGNTRLARRLAWSALYVSGVVLFMAACTLCSQTTNLLWLVLLMLVGDIGMIWYAVKQGLPFELLLERRFRHVCVGIDFTGVGRSWKYGCYGAFVRGDTKTIYPKLRDANGHRGAFTATVIPFAGQTVAEYNDCSEAFTLAFNVPFVSFEPTGTGVIRMRCGEMQVPDTYEAPVAIGGPSPEDEARALLQAVPIAVDLNGNVFTLPIEGNHLLIIGRTGAGKGSWIYQLVGALEMAHQAGLVRYIGIDPKRTELALARPLWDEYANSVGGYYPMKESEGYLWQA